MRTRMIGCVLVQPQMGRISFCVALLCTELELENIMQHTELELENNATHGA